MNRYFLDPFGCVKNQVDAENMMAHLNKAGWENVSDSESADLIIVNSCGFIESAKQESIDAVLEWRKLYPDKKILLSGCLSQRYAKDLPDILKEADGFIGIDDPALIAQAANKILSVSSNSNESKHRVSQTENSRLSNKKLASIPVLTGERPLLSLPGSAYVKISEGCENRCSYCAIPIIRGSLVSRPISDIVEECETLLKRGIIELNIIGQDIGAYGMDLSDESKRKHIEEEISDTDITNEDFDKVSKLPELLNTISKLEGNFWVRLLYIHPDHFPLQILDLIERDKRFLPYFDIPFQHASTKILTAMNRNKKTYPFLRHANHKLEIHLYDDPAKRYLALLEIIRSRLPDAVIRSTFMLGFPGETEEDFAELLDFQKKANIDWLGCFTYSREEGTASYSMKGRVPEKVAVMRKSLIEEKQLTITEKNMERFVDQVFDVLIEEEFAAEGTDSNEENIWLGRLFCQAPEIDGTAVIISPPEDPLFQQQPRSKQPEQENLANEQKLQAGVFVRCKVTSRMGFDLEVRPINIIK